MHTNKFPHALIAGTLFTVISLASTTASAQQQSAVPLPPENQGVAARPTQTFAAPTQPIGQRWYGWQMLAADVPLFVLSNVGTALSLGGSDAGFPLSMVASTGLLLSGPIIHWVHGHVGRGFASLFGLRLGLPLVGFVAGALIGSGFSNFSSGRTGGDFFQGALIGLALTAPTSRSNCFTLYKSKLTGLDRWAKRLVLSARPTHVRSALSAKFPRRYRDLDPLSPGPR